MVTNAILDWPVLLVIFTIGSLGFSIWLRFFRGYRRRRFEYFYNEPTMVEGRTLIHYESGPLMRRARAAEIRRERAADRELSSNRSDLYSRSLGASKGMDTTRKTSYTAKELN